MPASAQPIPGTAPGSKILDGPPPSPALEQGMNPGMPLGSLVQPVSADQVPPQVLTGMLEAGEEMSKMLDSFAQALPQHASDVGAVKEALNKLMSRILMAGAGPTSPTNPGPNFPGGGFERGGMPLASGG